MPESSVVQVLRSFHSFCLLPFDLSRLSCYIIHVILFIPSQVFASSKYPGPPSLRDFESVFADAVYHKRQIEDEMAQVHQQVGKAAFNNAKKTKDNAIFYTVPLQGGTGCMQPAVPY